MPIFAIILFLRLSDNTSLSLNDCVSLFSSTHLVPILLVSPSPSLTKHLPFSFPTSVILYPLFLSLSVTSSNTHLLNSLVFILSHALNSASDSCLFSLSFSCYHTFLLWSLPHTLPLKVSCYLWILFSPSFRVDNLFIFGEFSSLLKCFLSNFLNKPIKCKCIIRWQCLSWMKSGSFKSLINFCCRNGKSLYRDQYCHLGTDVAPLMLIF